MIAHLDFNFEVETHDMIWQQMFVRNVFGKEYQFNFFPRKYLTLETSTIFLEPH